MSSDITENETTPRLPGERYVQLDFGGPMFPALVESARWNGWLRPLFRRDTADTLIAWLNEQASADPEFDIRGRFDGHTLIIVEGEHRYEYPPDPDGRYPVGAGGWCWAHPDHGDDVAGERV